MREQRAKRKHKMETLRKMKFEKAELREKQKNLKERIAYNIPFQENKNQKNIQKKSPVERPKQIQGFFTFFIFPSQICVLSLQNSIIQ